MSLSADEYIRRIPYVSENGEITLGSKNTIAFLVDAMTGRVVRTYRLDGSPSDFGIEGGDNNNALVLPKNTDGLLEPGGSSDLGSYKNLIYITRTDYLLQHFSPNSSKVLWKVAFADMEAEFRCQSSFSGISLNGEMDTNEDEWQLPCQMKTNVLRIRDDRLLEFDKLPIAPFGGGASSLPASVRAPPLAPVKDIPLALPADGEKPMLPNIAGRQLALPAPDGNAGMREISSLPAHVDATTSIWSVFATHQIWSIIVTLVSILGVIFYSYFVLKKRGKSNEPVDELKLQSGVPKKKKGRKSGNKASPKKERQQKSPSFRNEVIDSRGYPQLEENERKLLLTFPNLIDGRADGRRIGKLFVSNQEIAKGSNGTVVLEGIYDGRPVAVKRLVQTHHDVALKEIQNLIASDQHQNIVRWYGVEFDQDFVYLALERCTCSLSDLIYACSDSFQNQTLPTIMDTYHSPEYTIRLPSILERDGKVELWKANGYPSTQLLKLMRLA